MKKIALSGIKPTGELHIGNYLGMIKPALDLAAEYQTAIQELLIHQMRFNDYAFLDGPMEGGNMIDKNILCEKIRSIYPDIGECGIAVKVEYDDKQKRWVIDLKKNGHELKTYLEDGDAEKCLKGIQCVSLGIEIAQLRGNIDRM